MKKYLLTGIPRSGTTLSCKVLNTIPNVVALHEPLSPNQFKSAKALDACEEVKERINQITSCLLDGKPFTHGHKESLHLDNPIEVTNSMGLRKLTAKRGMLMLPPQLDSTHLIVKQNALFASLLPQLISEFTIVSVIRNPVDVLLSWSSVDLPVNRGRIPAGEKYDNTLRSYLDTEQSVSKRQVYIYQWFMKQYQSHPSKIVKYEDIIATHGLALTNAFAFKEPPNISLKNVDRHFDHDLLREARKIIKTHLKSLSSCHYTQDTIMQRLDEVSHLIHD